MTSGEFCFSVFEALDRDGSVSFPAPKDRVVRSGMMATFPAPRRSDNYEAGRAVLKRLGDGVVKKGASVYTRLAVKKLNEARSAKKLPQLIEFQKCCAVTEEHKTMMLSGDPGASSSLLIRWHEHVSIQMKGEPAFKIGSFQEALEAVRKEFKLAPAHLPVYASGGLKYSDYEKYLTVASADKPTVDDSPYVYPLSAGLEPTSRSYSTQKCPAVKGADFCRWLTKINAGLDQSQKINSYSKLRKFSNQKLLTSSSKYDASLFNFIWAASNKASIEAQMDSMDLTPLPNYIVTSCPNAWQSFHLPPSLQKTDEEWSKLASSGSIVLVGSTRIGKSRFARALALHILKIRHPDEIPRFIYCQGSFEYSSKRKVLSGLLTWAS